ncbi:MAG: hypothetical protein AAGF95_33220 [Chloroflexota bacterium]
MVSVSDCRLRRALLSDFVRTELCLFIAIVATFGVSIASLQVSTKPFTSGLWHRSIRLTQTPTIGYTHRTKR